MAAATALTIGSGGGDTSVYYAVLAALPRERYAPVAYVAADTDVSSQPTATAAGALAAGVPWYAIARSREVGGSYVGAVHKVAVAVSQCLTILRRTTPDVLLVNGPGTAFPVAAAALLLRFAGICDTHIVYVESIARVTSLSLTGKLLYPVADAFYVQWPALAAAYPRAVYIGIQK